MIAKNLIDSPVWDDFTSRFNLSSDQLDAFKQYCDLLLRFNEQFNITAITDIPSIVRDHFEDSLMIKEFLDFSSLRMFADVGSGAGFPGLPLKIVYPHIPVVLIEVSKKKGAFLAHVADLLGLSDVIVSDLDWRTFLRKTEYPIDLFCSRASLQPEELIRIFKPESPYKAAHLVYWASRYWDPSSVVAPFIEREEPYSVGTKMRTYIIFSNREQVSLK